MTALLMNIFRRQNIIHIITNHKKMKVNLPSVQHRWGGFKTLLTLFLVLACIGICASVNGEEPEYAGLQGSGTKEEPYLIATAEDWNAFCQKVEQGETSACAKMTANVGPVVTKLGTIDKPYAGTFNGGGYTLDVDITYGSQFAAPFYSLRGATVEDLNLTGTVHQTGKGSNKYHTSGFAGRVDGATFNRVVSAVDVRIDEGGTANAGGLVGHGVNSTIYFNDCAFTGSFTQGEGHNESVGGFVGWCDSGGKFIVSNSFVDLKLTNIGGLNNFVRAQAFVPANSKFTNCFYTVPDGVTDWDAEPATKVTPGQLKSGFVANLLQNAHGADDMVWGQTLTGTDADQRPVITKDTAKRVFKVDFTYNNNVAYTAYGHKGDVITLPDDYAKSGVEMPVYIKPADKGQLSQTIADADIVAPVGNELTLAIPQSERYTITAKANGTEIADGSALSEADDLVFTIEAKPGYKLLSASTMTMKAAGGSNYAPFTEPGALKTDDEGVMHLSTTADWDIFAQYGSEGTYVLDNDIKTVTTSAANVNRFKGTFDGKGHTLDINLTGGSMAPFRLCEYPAKIKDLRVTGNINDQQGQWSGGLVSWVAGDSKPMDIIGCDVAVNINSGKNGDGSHGGLIGHGALARVVNTLFSGSINGASTNNCAGFFGWINNNLNTSTTNSLITATFTVQNGGSATFERGTYKPITHSYYKNLLGAEQGTKATDAQLTSGELAWELEHYSEENCKADMSSTIAWGQTLTGDNADPHPVPTLDESKRVFRAQFVDDKGNVVYTSYATRGQNFTMPTEEELGVSKLVFEDYEAAPASADVVIKINATNAFTVPKGDNYTVSVTRGDAVLGDGDTVYMNDELTYTVTPAEGYKLLTDAVTKLKGNEVFPTPVVLPTDEAGYVKIATIDDWNAFTQHYNNEHNYALAADIEGVTTMVGTADKPFANVFDGRGHKLTLKYELADSAQEAQQVVAPFRFVRGASIVNLRTDGVITTNKGTNDVGGIIGNTLGNGNTLTNCESYITDNFRASGDATNGGLIGRVKDNSNVSIDNCAFKGTFNAPNRGTNFGGLVGFFDSNAGSASIKNSLVAATFNVTRSGNGEYGNAPFSRRSNASSSRITISNSYYLPQSVFDVTANQGESVTAEQLKNGFAAHALQAGQEQLVWGQDISGDAIDAMPVLMAEPVEANRVYQAAFADTHSDKVVYTHANPGQEFPEPTAEQLGVKTVTTSYDKEPAKADITATYSAYNDTRILTIPTGEGYAVTVTRDGKPLENGAELYDTDDLVYTVKALDGFFLLTDPVNKLKGNQDLATPVVLTADDEGYALITSADDWNTLGSHLAEGKYRLTANITIKTMLGTKDKPFRGEFDGNNHTITLDLNCPDENDVAPFSIVRNATLKNIVVEGEIHSNMSAGDAAGLVGEAFDNVTVENVTVAAYLYWTKNGKDTDMTSSGLIGRVNDNTRATINNCLFDGAIIDTAEGDKVGHSVAGFIGWAHGTNVNVSISNSLVVGSFEVATSNNNTGNQAFARKDGRANLTITNSYISPYKSLQFHDQGTEVTDELLRSGEIAYQLQSGQEKQFWGQKVDERPGWGESFPMPSSDAAKRVYRVSYGFGNILLYSAYGNDQNEVWLPELTDVSSIKLPSYLVASHFGPETIVVNQKDTVVSIGDHLTLKLPEGKNYTISATLGGEEIANGKTLSGEGDLVFRIVPNSGYKLFSSETQVMADAKSAGFAEFVEPSLMAMADDGTYTIGSREEWDSFATSGLQEGNFRLTADIDSVKTMVGTQAKPFKGTFDGGGHTLSVDYNVSGEKNVAPFRFVNGATFKNLHAAGTIVSTDQFAGGIVGEALNQNAQSKVTFTNCHSSVSMQWTGKNMTDMTWGGFLGVARAETSFDNCLFDGTIISGPGETTRYAWNTGGFLGWADRQATVRNSLMAARISSSTEMSHSYNNATFGRGGTNGSMVNVDNSTCFYYRDKITGADINNKYYYQGTPLNSTDAVVANGSLAYMLQGTDSVQHWGQKIDTDNSPLLTSDYSKHVFKNVYDDKADSLYANTVMFDETKGNNANIAANAAATGSVKLVRTFDEGWNTLVLPFSLTTEEVVKAFGESTEVAYLTSTAGSTINLNTSDTTKAIAANVPVLIKPANTKASEFAFNAKTIEKKDNIEADGESSISFIGSYAALFTVPADDYYFVNGNNLWQSRGESTIKATRGYFHVPAAAGAKVRMFIDGEEIGTTTGIDAINGGNTGNNAYGSAVYTISGQKVADSLDEARKAGLPSGVYIVKGKKIIIK